MAADLGQPSSYLVLEQGVPVYSCDGEELGKVEHVLRDPDENIFDGLVLDTSVLPGGHRFVDAEQVEEIFERGVLLKLDRAAADGLREPSANPAVLEADPADAEQSELSRKLRRAWDLISGNY
ncbi:MAG: PRC-barrel domain-containing protein [Actinomycetota bacterium]|nr:PRC-barrel domain-containing protein [Actinomycetota bacterium]